jgi:hypothetical protein
MAIKKHKTTTSDQRINPNLTLQLTYFLLTKGLLIKLMLFLDEINLSVLFVIIEASKKTLSSYCFRREKKGNRSKEAAY